MNQINLNNLELKTFTEQNILDYCLLNNINLDDIIILNLRNNKLKDISGIKLFKNLEILDLYNNLLTNISVLKDLNNLEFLDISNTEIKNISIIQNFINLKYLNIIDLELKSDQIQYINKCKNQLYLNCKNGFKDMSVLNQFNKNIKI